jgi:hypothetical protein
MRKFTRTKEDFICKNCSQFIKGNGYTNHCNLCLYSLHVDNNPGDRSQMCRGLMIPIDIITKGGEPHSIIHKCTKCSEIKKNIITSSDYTSAIIKVMEYRVIKDMIR